MGRTDLRALAQNLDQMGFFPRTHAVFGAMAEFEKSLIVERTHAGLAAGRARPPRPRHRLRRPPHQRRRPPHLRAHHLLDRGLANDAKLPNRIDLSLD